MMLSRSLSSKRRAGITFSHFNVVGFLSYRVLNSKNCYIYQQ